MNLSSRYLRVKGSASLEPVDKFHQAFLKYQRDNNIIWDDMTVLGYKAE